MTRSLPVAGLTAGLMLFCLAIFTLAYLAGEAKEVELHEHATVDVNGTMRRIYPVPSGENMRTEATYSFASGQGTALVVPCSDQGWAAENWSPAFVIERQGPTSAGVIVAQGSSPGQLTLFEPIPPMAPPEPGATSPHILFCAGRSLVFEWDAETTSEPTVDVVVRETPLDGGLANAAVTASILGLLLAGIAGAWLMKRHPATMPSETETTVEALGEALRLSTTWLERSRTHLLAAGLLGIIVWYPVLLPWAWRAGSRASSTGWGPWVLTGLLLVALLVATAIWGWRLLSLDRDLRTWRNRLEALQRREQRLLDDIEAS